MSNYAAKSENVRGVDTLQCVWKDYLANVKSEADKLDIDEFKNVPNGLNFSIRKVDKLDIRKLETTPVDLKTFSNVVEKEVCNKIVYDELVKKCNCGTNKIV